MRILVFTSVIAAAGMSMFQTDTLPPYTTQALSPEDVHHQIAADKIWKQYKVAEKIARRAFKTEGCNNGTLAGLTAHNAVDQHIPVRVLSALIFEESSCHPAAVARRHGKVTACGLTQVNPAAWNISCEALQNPQLSIELGTRILASYKRRYGLRGGLEHYLGIGNDGALDSAAYATKVLTLAGLQ
jgi:hypothetical protein